MKEKLLRYITNESTPEEKIQIEEWIDKSDTVKNLYIELKTIWNNSSEDKLEWDTDKAWRKVSHSAGIDKSTLRGVSVSNQPRQYHRLRDSRYRHRGTASIARAAAIAILLVSIPLFIIWKSGVFNKITETDIALREVVTTKGQFTKIILSDGTNVLLNAESKLQFPEQFTNTSRELRLEGEAFIEVKNDTRRPFRVYAGGAVIEVLGTSFNVNTRFFKDGGVNVVVSEGVVTLRSELESNEKALKINQGMMGNWNHKTGTSIAVEVELYRKLAWVRGELFFESTPLTEVITQLERRYNIIIKVEDESLLNRRLTASYHVEPIEEIIRNVALTVGVTFRKESDKIYVFR